jgi:hypothetical protein
MNKRRWFILMVAGLLAACGEQRTTPTTTLPPPATLDLMVGTLNRGTGQGNGTHVVVYVSFAEKPSDTDLSVSLTGPAGWNGNQSITFNTADKAFLIDYGWRAFPVFTADAKAGEYKLGVTLKGQAYSKSDTLTDPSFSLAPPTLTLSSSTKTQVDATWSAVAGAASYTIGLFKGNYEQQIGVYQATKATSFSLTNLNLAPGTYLVEVTPSTSDYTGVPTKQRPYGVSFANVSFTVN